MRLESVRVRGIGPFRDELKLDLSELGDAVLVAVCGDNGAGKSTLLELAIPGAFYRKMPTQGSLRDRAAERDSLLEVVVTGAERYTIRHLVDGVSGKGESVVLDAAGKPVSGSTKVSDFDSWALRTLPPEDVLLASTFGAQQDSGFLGASPSDRKAILLRALGIARYEAWASGASESARACKQALDVTRARLDEARSAGGDVAVLSAALGAAEAEAKRVDAKLAEGRAGLSALEAAVREAQAAEAAHVTHVAQQGVLRARVLAFEAKRADVETRIAACNRTLAQEPAIRQAALKLEGVREQLAETAQKRTALTARDEAALERRRAAKSQADEARRHHARVATRVRELEQLVAAGAEIAQAEADLRAVEAELIALRQAAKSADAAYRELSAATIDGAEARVGGLRGGLESVGAARALSAAHGVARTALEQDAAAVLEASQRPAKLDAARKAQDDSRARCAAAERRQQQLGALARRAGELTAAKDQIRSLSAELEQHAATILAHQALAEQAEAQARLSGAELQELDQLHRLLTEQEAQLRPLADQLPHIALAASKLEERMLQQAEVAGEIDAATWALSELGPPPAPVAVPDVAPQRAQVLELEQAARRCHQGVAVAASKLETGRAMAEQCRVLGEQQRTEETELGDWARLADDLGRKGLQAAEIDGCGPELTTLVNDLLHSAHGPRFTVRIDTQQLSADGKKTLEGCRVTVIDSLKGREDEGSKFSGGERVIIGEACALGLSMLACQRSGMRGVTLVRDETGAALDPGNAEVYVKMLRRAAEQIGADRVLFVTHSAEVAELADARITVADGRVSIGGVETRAPAEDYPNIDVESARAVA